MARLSLRSSAALVRTAARSKLAAAKKKNNKRPLFTEGKHDISIHPNGDIELTLPIRLTNGNEGRNRRFGASHAFRKECEIMMRSWFAGDTIERPMTQPVSLQITRILSTRERMWDPDSIGRGNAKELIDSLVATGWFHDDKAKWITHVDYQQDAKRRPKAPAVSVLIIRN